MRIDKGQLSKDLQQRLWLVGNDLTNLMVRRVAVDTGGLKNSIRFDVEDDGTINFYMMAHGAHIEYGTKPHVIKAKNKKVLSDGKNIYGKVVNHPGTQAQPFIRPSLHQLGKILKKRLDGAKITVKV